MLSLVVPTEVAPAPLMLTVLPSVVSNVILSGVYDIGITVADGHHYTIGYQIGDYIIEKTPEKLRMIKGCECAQYSNT
ncbi:unnamed protein product [marine sediment metagenome]|uniref:Uncharacterized protein n=1 Tax=marine sediment metagenome TaxID=412755 RepID=X1CRD1_9ZZZZ